MRTLIIAALLVVGCAPEDELEPLCVLTVYPDDFLDPRPHPIVTVDHGDGEWVDPEWVDCHANMCDFTCTDDTERARLQWPGIACDDTVVNIVDLVLTVNIACE